MVTTSPGLTDRSMPLKHLERAKALAQALDADERLIGLCGGRVPVVAVSRDDSPSS